MPPAENNETPKYNLPPPVNETGGELANDQTEQAPASPELANNVKAPKAGSTKTPIIDFKLKDFSVRPPTSVASTTSNDDNPTVADDQDLIEKEWVNKAKKIIDESREDPYNQSKEMTNFKADYMKKRYNKVIKVGD